MPIQNTLAANIEPPVHVSVKTPKSTVDLYFLRASIRHRILFDERFGKGVVDAALQKGDIDMLGDVLYILLSKESKETLDEIKDEFLDYDLDDDEKLVNLAPKRVDRLKFILGSDGEALTDLILGVFGLSREDIEPKQKKKEVAPTTKAKTGQA